MGGRPRRPGVVGNCPASDPYRRSALSSFQSQRRCVQAHAPGYEGSIMRTILAAAAALCMSAVPGMATTAWSVDHAKSRVGFSVQWSGQAFNATFHSWKADIAFDPADLGHSKVVATIDLNSEDSGSGDNDDGLKGAEGFAVDKFPTAKFETAGFVAKGGTAYVANGQLNLHGVT